MQNFLQMYCRSSRIYNKSNQMQKLLSFAEWAPCKTKNDSLYIKESCEVHKLFHLECKCFVSPSLTLVYCKAFTFAGLVRPPSGAQTSHLRPWLERQCTGAVPQTIIATDSTMNLSDEMRIHNTAKLCASSLDIGGSNTKSARKQVDNSRPHFTRVSTVSRQSN